MLKKLVLLLISVSLFGCGGTIYPSVGKYQLLANINGHSGQYKVDSISNVEGNADLNNFRYRGDTEPVFCGRQSSLSNPVYCRENSEFYSRSLDLIVNNSTVNQYNVYLKYSPYKFNRALEQALLSGGLDRANLSSTFDAFVDDYQKVKDTVNAQVAVYKANVEKIKVINHITDESGFYSDELNGSNFAHTAANDGMHPFEFTVKPTEFYSFLESEKKRISDVAALTSSIINTYSVICTNPFFNEHKFNGTCTAPNSVSFTKSGDQSVAAEILITSKDFGIVPINYKNEDKNISIKTDGETIAVRNLTNKFISIVSISIYYGTDEATPISTFNWEKADAKYKELPPKASSKIPVTAFFTSNDYRDYKKLFEFNKMTVGKAKSTNFEYGIAAKYSIGNKSVEETLYKTSSYNVYKLLVN